MRSFARAQPRLQFRPCQDLPLGPLEPQRLCCRPRRRSGARAQPWAQGGRLDAGPSLLFWVVIGLATAAIALAVAVRCGAARGKAERLEALLGA